MTPTNVLFICLGNICRSPTAHGIFQAMVVNAGLNREIHIDSAGTSDWHIGEPPDQRSIIRAGERGYDLSMLRARQVQVRDFDQYDYILAMDSFNLSDLEKMKPPTYRGHLGLFLTFSTQSKYAEVPDPYHGGKEGFELVLNLVEDAAQGLLQHIQHKDLAV